ncbi:hypothetical protein M422DRAFT_83015, partial [Sphaerobolus stellatus SS14]
LSPDEFDLICDVYHISQAPGRTPSDFSWWPKPNVWDNSGLYIGYWSSECEAWFKDHVDNINNGKARLKANDDWRH